ncbi:serine O-acetyltransferase [Arenibaculum pallidiluteum]|uniref:serine O-acetyltransferase n=1 Tax=Arenibaculum pallidiluteum TaxID=2812559 RepID=UPI001A97BC19|nr:serine O-acetyltransferase [Arenibaculum pallidiluteum]
MDTLDTTSRTLETWLDLRREAETIARREPFLARHLDVVLLGHATFDEALAGLVAHKLFDDTLEEGALRDLVREAAADRPEIVEAALADLRAVLERDPAAGCLITPFLYYKGYQGLQTQRVANWLWAHGRVHAALYLQSRVNERFGMDIHPAARIGRGVMIDHGTGVVIGETAVVGDNVSMLQEVTLGGTGKVRGDRHPKVRDGVLIGAGAKILGNIVIGEAAKVGAGSVVLHDVPAHCTVVGVPAQVVSRCCPGAPALSMDHMLPEE